MRMARIAGVSLVERYHSCNRCIRRNDAKFVGRVLRRSAGLVGGCTPTVISIVLRS